MLERRILRLSYRRNRGDHGERKRSGLSPEQTCFGKLEPHGVLLVTVSSRGLSGDDRRGAVRH